MLIGVSGVDGAGKSTAIAALQCELERQGRLVTVLHLNDHVGLYAWLRAARNAMFGIKRSDNEPPRMDPSPSGIGRVRDTLVWSKVLRRILYPLDVLVFLVIRAYVEVLRRRVLMLDRYFYDRLVDIAPSSDSRAGWAVVRALARITPTPSLAVLLEVDPAVAFARKGEYSVPYLERRAAAYRRVFARLPAAIRISSDEPGRVSRAVSAAWARTESRGRQLRSSALRLLLDPGVDPDEIDWADLRPVAERGGVIVRLADALQERGEALPSRFAAAAAKACTRTQQVLEIVDRLGERCVQLGIQHAFLKTAERYPDTGRDVDLLVAETSPRADRAILAALPAALRARGASLRNRLAGSRTYDAAHGIVVDIAHGRLGKFGEQARFARLVLANAAPAPVGPTSFVVPAAADHFLLLATQQVYTRPALRLADVYGAIVMLRRPEPLNWDYVFATALAMGMVPAVGAYLEYIDRMYVRTLNRPLLDDRLLDRFQSRHRAGPGQDIRFPRIPVARRLYLSQLHATIEAGRWHSAARLSLMPVIAGLRLSRIGRGA
jgi:thymidylate kinase